MTKDEIAVLHHFIGEVNSRLQAVEQRIDEGREERQEINRKLDLLLQREDHGRRDMLVGTVSASSLVGVIVALVKSFGWF